MTRSEQFRKSRAWLKTRSFVITNSLMGKLEGMPPDQRERHCYVQNKVLITADEMENPWASIPCGYWREKLGSSYRDTIDQLIGMGELEVDEDFRWSKDKSGYPKSYAVPSSARASGTLIVDFKRQRVRLPRPKNNPTDAASEYALQCLKKLSVAKELRFPPPRDPSKDPAIRMVRIREHCEGIAGGDFRLKYGKNVGRLYHRVVAMPSEGRCNLTFPHPLYEFDVATCHPVLMLSLFDDSAERKHYAEMLAGDIYQQIGDDMGVPTRKQVKDDFQRIVNSGQKRLGWILKQYPFQFYVYHFPKFAKVLRRRTDLAFFLQNFEARLMVQKLGSFCRDKNLFWVPMHDGFLSREDHGEIISSHAATLVANAVGFSPVVSKSRIE